MTIETIKDNLIRTINGKRNLIEEWRQVPKEEWKRVGITYENMVKLVKINIDELNAILDDVEKVINKDKQDYWVIRKTPNTKDQYYVESGEPPQHVKEVYGITR